ncbi:site-specific DNA-methyltransferase [Staphylococcus aureus]|uniref:site-specific DNA-methyltransferase n=1 Tax=Staphylococcus aureus TaxID=1280 RepID=UPI00214766C4|nr:site-specific DNA-methyltransferase [Staphylococcus aureus]MCQ9882291.1 site-specific DNA-methyltransferase [Staphylococcus aureus]WEH52236.1 site-specific DNA-methyltransferase [Staphylococcus aureus]
MNGESLDITKENIDKLKKLFPEIVTDGEKIDFEKLKTILGEEVEGEKERYSLNWPGKKAAILGAQKPSKGTLRLDKKRSKNFDITENLYIEGDNLEVLKLLQKSYNNKIKMIYMDPPYNTGNDFVYKDSFEDSLENYLEVTGQIDENGNFITANVDKSGKYHSNWLNMMYPRIKLSRNLLTNDGALMISIDDNEIENLVKITKETFGEKNVKVIAVKMSESSGLKMTSVNKLGTIPKLKEYIVIAKKDGLNKLYFDLIDKEEWDDEYNIYLENFDENDKKIIDKIKRQELITEKDIEFLDKLIGNVELKSVSKKLKELAIDKQEKIMEWKRKNSYRICRSVASDSVLNLAKIKKIKTDKQLFFVKSLSGELYFVKGNYNEQSKKPRLQMIFAEDNLTVHPGDFWMDIKTTGLDNEGIVPYKNGKKPLKLLVRLLNSITNNDDENIILDCFSGSASTAHAVMKQNQEFLTNNKFIMIQLPENLYSSLENTRDSKAKKQIQESIDFLKNYNKPANLSELGMLRIDLNGEKLYEYGSDKKLDIGYKVFKLDKSNIREWNSDFDDLEDNLFAYEDVFVEGRSELDVVYEIMLKNGLDLTYKVNQFEHAGRNIYDVAYGNLFVCLADDIDVSVAQGIIDKRNEYGTDTSSVVLKDAGFKSDADKLNVIELLKDSGYPEENILTI